MTGQHGWVDQMVLSFVDPDGDSSSPSQLASRNLYGDAVDQIFATESGSGDVFWALTDHQDTPHDRATRSAFGTTTIAQHTRYNAFGTVESVCISHLSKGYAEACDQIWIRLKLPPYWLQALGA